MDENQEKNDSNVNHQLTQDALSSVPNQQQQQQNNTYTTFFQNDANFLLDNAINFETLASFQNYLGDTSLCMQSRGTPSSANSTTSTLQQQRVDNTAPNIIQNENEYIYQQYLQLMSSVNQSTPEFNFHDFTPQQQQQQQQQPPPPLQPQQQSPAIMPGRREQDVFSELLSMASNRDGYSWLNRQFAAPSSSSSSHVSIADASMMIAQHQQQQQETSFYDNFPSSSSSNFTLPSQQDTTKGNSPMVQDFAHPFTQNYRHYKLEIVQQPSRARMCGYGDKDRRPISPPPILKLTVLTNNGQVINPETIDISFLVTMCDACQQSVAMETKQNNNSSLASSSSAILENTTELSKTLEKFSTHIVSFPNNGNAETGKDQFSVNKMKNLVGASVVSATKLYDLDGKLGIFFVFQDISLRTEGVFRLQFSLINLGSPQSHRVNTTTPSQVVAIIETDAFTVYTAKKYPGVVHSTPLSKCFARQGIKIPIRKEKIGKKNDRRSSLGTIDLSEDETEDDDSQP